MKTNKNTLTDAVGNLVEFCPFADVLNAVSTISNCACAHEDKESLAEALAEITNFNNFLFKLYVEYEKNR